MLRIGVDLDDCLIRTSQVIIQLLNRINNLSLDWNKIENYSIEKSFGLSPKLVEQHVKMALESSIIEPEYNAVKIFNQLSDLYSCFIISRREHYLYNHTAKTLDNLGFNGYRLILFHENDNGTTPKYNDKHEIVNKYDINLMIEDRPSTIENIAKHTEAETLIVDKPWNRKIQESFNKRRVHSWVEIRNYIIERTVYGY